MPTKLICPACKAENEFPQTDEEISKNEKHLVCSICGHMAYYGAWFRATNKAAVEKVIKAGEPRNADEALARMDCFGVGPRKPYQDISTMYLDVLPSEFQADLTKVIESLKAYAAQVIKCRDCAFFDRCIRLQEILLG